MRRMVIKAAQRVGISLEEIREALASLPDARTPPRKTGSALEQCGVLDTKIAYLKAATRCLYRLHGCGCLSMKNCPIYNPEDKLRRRGRAW